MKWLLEMPLGILFVIADGEKIYNLSIDIYLVKRKLNHSTWFMTHAAIKK